MVTDLTPASDVWATSAPARPMPNRLLAEMYNLQVGRSPDFVAHVA